MSRGTFMLGLVLSLVAHGWLLSRSLPAPATEPTAGPPTVRATPVVPIVQTELARVEPAETAPPPPPAQPPRAAPPPPEPTRPDTSASAEPERRPSPPAPDVDRAPRPAPPLARTASADRSSTGDDGDFAGASDGRRQPALRVDWGTRDEALATVAGAGMQIVLLDADDLTITHEIARTADGWMRHPYRPPAGSTRFSNRLRIVDNVPAFGDVRRAATVRGTERLAILVPVPVERMLDAAQLQAAIRRGLAPEEVRSFAGRFTRPAGELAFEITHLDRHDGP